MDHTNCPVADEDTTSPDYNGSIKVTEYCSHNRVINTYFDSIL